MASVQCRIEIPEVRGLKENELTVGREFHLLCEGEFPKLDRSKLSFKTTPEQKYVIKFLNADFKSATQADFTVTSYVAAAVQIPDLQLTDGTETVSLGHIEYKLESVLPPQAPPTPGEQPAKQEPYGPIGPASIAIPPMYWLILLGVILLAGLLVVIKILRVVQRRNMIERLKEHDSAMSPLTQFHTSMRRLQRSNPLFFGGNADETAAAQHVQTAMEEMRHMLRLYITRKYQMPALEWSARLIVKDLKKYHRKIYVEAGADLKSLIKEYQHAFEHKEKVTGNDVINISKRTRQLVERMEGLS